MWAYAFGFTWKDSTRFATPIKVTHCMMWGVSPFEWERKALNKGLKM